MDFDLSTTLRQVRRAALSLARLSAETRNQAILALSQTLLKARDEILEANTLDLEASRGQQGWVLEGMKLTPERIERAAQRLQHLALAPDPIGYVQASWRTPKGDLLTRLRVPLGVIALAYEIHPEFLLQGLGMGLKTANGLVLCSGDTLTHTHQAIVERLSEAAYKAGIPEGSLQLAPAHQIQPPSDGEARLPPLLQQSRFVDLVIPCGRSSWVEALQQCSSTPVLATALGYGHLYLDQSASWPLVEMLLNSSLSTKALDMMIWQPVLMSILIHPRWAEQHLSQLLSLLQSKEVALQADPALGLEVKPIDDGIDSAALPSVRLRATADVQEAIQWINKQGSQQIEAICSDSQQAINRFVQEVDAATLVINQSPLHLDYPLDVLMPSSCQKLHARGPLTLEALTTVKYVLAGKGLRG